MTAPPTAAAADGPKSATAAPVWTCDACVRPRDVMTMSDMTRPRYASSVASCAIAFRIVPHVASARPSMRQGCALSGNISCAAANLTRAPVRSPA